MCVCDAVFVLIKSCALGGSLDKAPRQHRQKVIADIKCSECNYQSQQIIKGDDNKKINIFIVRLLLSAFSL